MAQRKQLPHSAQLCMISRTRISARVLRPAGRHGAKFEVMFLAYDDTQPMNQMK